MQYYNKEELEETIVLLDFAKQKVGDIYFGEYFTIDESKVLMKVLLRCSEEVFIKYTRHLYLCKNMREELESNEHLYIDRMEKWKDSNPETFKKMQDEKGV